MKNSENLFFHAKKYQDERKAIIEAYEKKIASLEDAKGSKLYEKESKKAAEDRDNALTSLKAEYSGGFNSILKEMRNASDTRGATPPTEEELRLVQALKLKETATQAELDRIANAVKGNGLCLSIVQDVAKKNGVMRNYISLCTEKAMPAAGVDECLKSLVNGIKDFMESDISKAARLYKEQHERLYGKMDESKAPERVMGGYMAGYTPPAKRPLFDTKEGFYSVIMNLKGEELTAFCNSVDN